MVSFETASALPLPSTPPPPRAPLLAAFDQLRSDARAMRTQNEALSRELAEARRKEVLAAEAAPSATAAAGLVALPKAAAAAALEAASKNRELTLLASRAGKRSRELASEAARVPALERQVVTLQRQIREMQSAALDAIQASPTPSEAEIAGLRRKVRALEGELRQSRKQRATSKAKKRRRAREPEGFVAMSTGTVRSLSSG